MKIKNIIILLNILIFSLLTCGCDEQIVISKTPAEQIVATTSIYGEDFIYITNELKSLISENNDVNFDCVNDEKYIYFTVWQDGITEQAINAKNGEKQSVDLWNKNINLYKITQKDLYNQAKKLGLKSKPFRFAVLNENNKTNVLVVFQNGQLIYDFVNN